MADPHTGAGHPDVTLSLTEDRKGGGLVTRSWVVCGCSPLVERLEQVLGPPTWTGEADRAGVKATAAAVLDNSVQTGEGFGG